MPLVCRDLGNLTPTSSGSSNTVGIGHIDDASSITIWVSSSAGTASTGAGAPLNLQISQFDPSDAVLGAGVSQSTLFVNFSLTSTTAGLILLTTGQAYTISNVSFRGFRLTNLTSAVNAEVVAWATKQINV